MLLLCIRKSDVLLCTGIRCSVAARRAIVCGLELASWRSITFKRHSGTTEWWCTGSKVRARNTQTDRSYRHTAGVQDGRGRQTHRQTDWPVTDRLEGVEGLIAASRRQRQTGQETEKVAERQTAQLHRPRAPCIRTPPGIQPATWTRTIPGIKPATWLQQGGQLPTSFLSVCPVFPVCLGVRGYCSGKPAQPTDSAPNTPQPPEDQSEASQPPEHGLFKFKQLYENPWTVPNFLCVCRIILAPFLAHLIIEEHFDISLALFILAGATDVLDGYIARTWPSQKSALGSALDPLADKILISVLYVSLTYAQLIPAALTALVIFRDVGLIAAVFWVRYKTVPPPVTLSKFFNPCYTTAQLKPTLFSKVNTAIQLVLVAASLAAPVFQYTDSLLLQSLWYITAVTTAASGYSYWHYGRKTVRVLNTRSP